MDLLPDGMAKLMGMRKFCRGKYLAMYSTFIREQGNCSKYGVAISYGEAPNSLLDDHLHGEVQKRITAQTKGLRGKDNAPGRWWRTMLFPVDHLLNYLLVGGWALRLTRFCGGGRPGCGTGDGFSAMEPEE